jgi:Xaa-Pro dipeptidase
MKIDDIFNNVEAIYIANPIGQEIVPDLNFYYFTRLLDTGISEGASIFLSKNRKVIIVGELEEKDAKRSGFEVMVTKNKNDKEEILKKLLKDKKKIGVSFPSLTLQEFSYLKDKFPILEFIDISPMIQEIRSIKDDFEITLIKNAAKIAGESLEEALNYLKEGITEKEIASQLSILFIKNGADGNSFTPIVSFGENSADQHHFPGLRKLKKGDFVLIDIGAKYMRYNSDITRTYIFGKGDEKQKRIYSTVKKVQEVGLNALKDGVNGTEVQNAMRKFIDTTEFKEHCNYGANACNLVGHGIGLAVHDYEAIPGALLKNNMVITVEPGIYLKDFGGVRIEDDVLIKENGYEILSTIDKKYREI